MRTPALLAAATALLASTAGAADVLLPADIATWTCSGPCGTSAADGDITLSPLGNPRHGTLTTFGSQAYGLSPLPADPNHVGAETNGARIVSPVFQAAAGDAVSLRFNYVSTDGKGYDDYAWARLLTGGGVHVAWLYTARSTNSNTGNVVPGDVVDRKDFDPDAVIVDYKDFRFTSKTTADPVDWSPLGLSNGTCWKDNAPGCGFTGWLHARLAVPEAGAYRVEIGIVNWGDTAYDSGLAFDYAGLAATAPVPEPAGWALALAGTALLARRLRRR
jgi:hypothetical protein